jgi:adenylate cyclase
MKPAVPENEKARQAALALYDILDTGQEQSYDDFTKIASYVGGTPIALITIVDKDRQWFKSKVGTQLTETPRDVSFCAHAILNPLQPLLVPDATKDARFSDNPVVTDEPRVRFYFGAPLVTPEKFALGTLCVIDTKPRELSREQVDVLKALARQVSTLLEIRRCTLDLRRAIETHRKQNFTQDPAIDEVEYFTSKLQSLLVKKELAGK